MSVKFFNCSCMKKKALLISIRFTLKCCITHSKLHQFTLFPKTFLPKARRFMVLSSFRISETDENSIRNLLYYSLSSVVRLCPKHQTIHLQLRQLPYLSQMLQVLCDRMLNRVGKHHGPVCRSQSQLPQEPPTAW